MKKTFYFLHLLLPMFLFSQNASDNIVYYDSIGREATKENHSLYRIIKEYYTEKDLYQIKEYYKSGVLEMGHLKKMKKVFQ